MERLEAILVVSFDMPSSEFFVTVVYKDMSIHLLCTFKHVFTLDQACGRDRCDFSSDVPCFTLLCYV